MNRFIVYPAIDLRQGKVVRLQYGDPKRQTTFSEDPLEVAGRWVEAGASWIHVVNLDGAFGESGARNRALLPRLATAGAKIQFGGGLRTLEQIAEAVEAGVARVILGTVAVEEPQLVAAAVRRFGSERVAVAIDARDGLVKTRGWQKEGQLTAAQLGHHMREQGVKVAIHTDIGRDGVLTGVNAAASAALAQASGLAVIASGGVASLHDVRAAAARVKEGVVGVITGRAVYEGRLDLAAAIQEVEHEDETS